MARSHKPIVWGLFAAGGTVSAFFVPVLALIIGLGVPLGLLSAEDLSYDRIYAFAANPFIRILLFGFITLCFWHGAHRTRTTAHDLGIQNDGLTALICYGIAACATVLAAIALIKL